MPAPSNAAGGSSDETMMARVVASHTTDQRALDAALRLSWSSARQGYREHRG